MNWNKLMNVLILLFVVMNSVIFGLNNANNEHEYVLTEDRENQLREILYANGITMYNFYPSYEPMASYRVSVAEYDRKTILNRLFDGMTYISEKGFGDEKVIYEKFTYNQEQITFYAGNRGGKIHYEGPSKLYKPEVFNLDYVVDVALDFSEDLTNDLTDFVVEQFFYEDHTDTYHILLNEENKERHLFSNYVELIISEEGILEADASLYPREAIANSKREIYPVDEMLYKWMDQIVLNSEEFSIIKKIELGYDLGIDELAKDATIEVMPHYRIIMQDGVIYEINAYTNVMRIEESK